MHVYLKYGKFLNCSLIDTLCEARHEEFETLYIKSKRKNKKRYGMNYTVFLSFTQKTDIYQNTNSWSILFPLTRITVAFSFHNI